MSAYSDFSATPGGMEVFAVSLCSGSRRVRQPCTGTSASMADLNTDVLLMTGGYSFRACHGTYLAFNIIRDQAATTSANLVLRLYGRKWTSDNSQHFVTMFNMASTPAIATTVTADDTNDAMTKCTTVDSVVKRITSDTAAQTYDKRGFDEFIVRITTAYASSGGTAAVADLAELVVREF